MYHQQQNKWKPQMCLLAHIEAIYSILTVANLLAHNNNHTLLYIYIYIFVQVKSLKLKYSVVSKWLSEHLCGFHLF